MGSLYGFWTSLLLRNFPRVHETNCLTVLLLIEMNVDLLCFIEFNLQVKLKLSVIKVEFLSLTVLSENVTAKWTLLPGWMSIQN